MRIVFIYTDNSSRLDSKSPLYSFEFTLSENNSRMVFDFKSELESGEVNIWLGGSGYEVIGWKVNSNSSFKWYYKNWSKNSTNL